MTARWRARAVTVLLAVATLGLSAHEAPAATSTFASGDVFVGVGSNHVQWRLPNGTLNRTLTTATSSSITTGMGFDDSGRLYVTGYTSNVVNRFKTNGDPDATFGSGFNSHPESIAFDRAGNAYVGQERGNRMILKFNAAGTLQASYAATTEGTHGTDRVDVAADQCTIYYTSQGKSIRRFNACTNAQAANLTTTLPGTAAYDVRVLPSGGVLVADTKAVYRLNDSGAITQTYDRATHDCWVGLALDPTGSAFWAADRCKSDVAKFDLASGSVLSSFATGTKSGTINGLSVSGGATAARYGADVSVSLADSADPVVGGGQVTYTATVSNAGPSAASGVGVSFSQSGGQVTGASGSGWSCSNNASSASCSLAGSIDPGQSASTVSVTVQAPQATNPTSISDTATVSSSDDLNGGNNTDTEQTTVTSGSSGTIPASGGSITTNTGNCVTLADPVCALAQFPAQVGAGGFASIAEDAQIGACGVLSGCTGPAVNLLPAPGWTDPNNPISVVIRYHPTVAAPTGSYSVYVEKLVGGITTTVLVPPCQPLGHAVPAPCVNGMTRDAITQILTVQLLVLSEDPKFQLVNGLGG